MANYRFFVSYEGTRYDGWQRQKNTDKTVQGKMEAVLGRLFEQPVQLQGSGRTDAGVHARAQVANFHMAAGSAVKAGRYEAAQIEEYLNRYLPEDICVYGLEETDERFHSRLSAVGKTYSYRIDTRTQKPVFIRRFVWHRPGKLDVSAMKRAAGYLTGTHDFASFCGNPHMKKSTVRTVDRVEIREEDGLITLSFHGNGFLQNMVRILVGTLAEVGEGRCEPGRIPTILAAADRSLAGPMAPAQGLCLESVDYDPPYDPSQNIRPR